MKILTDTDYKQFIAKDTLSVVDFHAVWCGPCKAMAPEFEGLSTQFPEVQFAKMDVDACPDAAAQYSIRAIPSVLLFKNGAQVDSVVGVNMADLRRKIRANS